MTVLARLVAAATQMRSHLRRTALAMLTTVVGIWAITTTVAVGEMGKAAALTQAELTQGRPATLRLDVADRNDQPVLLDQSDRLRVEDRLRRYGLVDFSPMATSTITVLYGSAATLVEARGVEPSFANVRLLETVAGTWLSAGAMTDRAPLLVANSAFVAALHLDTATALRTPLRLEALTPATGRVIGVVGSAPGDPPVVYLSIDSLESWGVAGSAVSYSYWIHVDPLRVDVVETLLSRDIGTWGQGLHATWTREDHVDEITRALAIFQIALTLIAGISLFTGGIGILNLGLVTVRQRVREFGHWRVFGAADRDIFTMVLLETVIVSMTGGAVAVASSILVLNAVPRWIVATPLGSPNGVAFPLDAAALGLTVSVLVGLMTGLCPAWAATRADVVDAIQP